MIRGFRLESLLERKYTFILLSTLFMESSSLPRVVLVLPLLLEMKKDNEDCCSIPNTKLVPSLKVLSNSA